MEKREYTVNELFENQILNDIYETRGDGIEGLYVSMFGEPEDIKETKQAKKELEDLMKELVKDEKNQKELWLKLDRFESCMSGEMSFWEKQYYKLGFLDRIYLKQEIKETRDNFFENKVDDINKNSYFHKYIDSIMQFLEDNRFKNWQKRKDYKTITDKMFKIKNKYPNVRTFVNDRVVIELTKEELQAVLEYISLDDEIEKIEMIETFKLGLKEGNSL